jgi:murein DD-endopeptidase MepM/ murein hydrolase activator NlpD
VAQYISKIRFLLIAILGLVFFTHINIKAQIFEPRPDCTIAESMNDSIDLGNIYDYFIDSLGIYFFSDIEYSADANEFFVELMGLDFYESWDSIQIHYPKFDFKNKEDTTYLLLVTENSQYVHPFDGKVTSNFGWRRRRFHYGTDINLNTGDTVLTSFDGIVRITKRSRSYGNVVVVRHFNGLETLYAHFSKILVSVGDTLKAGTAVGLGGNTGRSFGSHLHYELRYLGVALNPTTVIDFENKKLISDTLAISKSTFDYVNIISGVYTDSKNAKWVVVKRGDTLSHIAARNRTSVSRIQQLNNMRGTLIREGQKLRVQ